MGLGSIAVSPLDMASAYATLAAGGVACEPMAIRRVVLPDGTTDRRSASWGKKRCKRVLTEGEAYTVTEILEENVQYGTGTGRVLRPSGGRQDRDDGRPCRRLVRGYTPRLQTTVWVGYPKGEIPMENVHGISVTGGSFPAEIWRRFMGAAIGHLEPIEFEDAGRVAGVDDARAGAVRALVRLLRRRRRRLHARPPAPRRRRRAAHAPGTTTPAGGAEAAAAPAEAAADAPPRRLLHRRRRTRAEPPPAEPPPPTEPVTP